MGLRSKGQGFSEEPISMRLRRKTVSGRVSTGPWISVDETDLPSVGLSLDELHKYVPRYIVNLIDPESGFFRRFWIRITQIVLITATRLALRPRKGPVGDLDLEEVRKVYDREAASYDRKHHLTTRGTDTTWRRMAAYSLVPMARDRTEPLDVLDLCTGTGLTVKEMVCLLTEWGLEANITALDYNVNMLNIAKARRLGRGGITVRFVRGNAMELPTDDQPDTEGIQRFEQDSFDMVTQMFGIGGIADPLSVFRGVIEILRPSGRYCIIDMHQPVPSQPAECLLFLKWCRLPRFEYTAYNEHIVPVVLNRLWGWRDPTLVFYLLPLVTWQDSSNAHWGFKLISFETETQRWWLSLPLMPIAKILVEKTAIDEEESNKRKLILSLLTKGQRK